MYTRRKHRYIAMMIVCVTLFVLAWGVVRIWSVPAAVGMCVVAMVIPPVAAIVANRRGPDDYWWDEPHDAWLDDEPKDDSWRHDERSALDRAEKRRSEERRRADELRADERRRAEERYRDHPYRPGDDSGSGS